MDSFGHHPCTAALGVILALGVGTPVAAAQRDLPRAETPVTSVLQQASPEMQRAMARFLGDSLLGGRVPGSLEAGIAARFLASQFEAHGLAPGAPDGTYYQLVPLQALKVEASMVAGTGRRTVVVPSPAHFVAAPQPGHTSISLDGELVFAGHGIEAPDRGWDDYKGVPQTGRIVLVLPGEPDSPSGDSATSPTRYGASTYKIDQAARMGAAGILIIHSEARTGRSWNATAGEFTGDIIRRDDGSSGQIQFAGWIREEAIRALLQEAGRDYDLMVRRASLGDFSPLATGLHTAIGLTSSARQAIGINVIGRLAGSAPRDTRQSVLVTASYAAITSTENSGGVADSMKGSGAAAPATLISVAAAAARAPTRPSRNMEFLASAGGAGLEHYLEAADPTPAGMVAVISLADGPPRGRHVGVLGDRLSTLGTLAATAARAESIELDRGAATLLPGSSIWPFITSSLPALELAPDGTVTTVRLVLRVLWDVADTDQKPSWLGWGAPGRR